MEEEKVRLRKVLKTERVTQTQTHFAADYNQVKSSLPNFFGYFTIFLFLFCLRFFYNYENELPKQLSIKNAHNHPERFIGERAELQLKRLTDLGTRVVGSYENEVLAVDFLKREISFIAQTANKIHKIEIDVQKPTGSYYLFLRPYGFRNYYANIQNIVVRLSSTNSTNSVLMNCHYDTVPESPGASDNGMNVVIMLEIFRVLSSSNTPLKNNVIFLFNGAEENPLQASHGFLSHPWSKEVKALINLDSAGSGGKEVLFQTSGEPWLIDAYSKAVPRPCGAVQAEELFHYGVIPSDTDFRIFRDFGNYSGLDLAHCFNGFVYHTKYDNMDFIRPGVYQFTGDNMLALVKELINSPELGKDHEKTKLVYFDVFNLFLLSYSERVSVALNLMTVILSFFSIYFTCKCLPDFPRLFIKHLIYATGGSIVSLLVAGGVTFSVSKILDFLQSTMSWYQKFWLIIPLYGFPIVISMALLMSILTFSNKDSLEYKAIRLINGGKLFWTIALIMGTVLRIRSTFVLLVFLLPLSVGTLATTISKRRFSVKLYLIAHAVSLVFPNLYTFYQIVKILVVIIPMTARMGPHTNPEIVIGALVFLIMTKVFSNYVPLLLLLKNLKSFLITLGVLHIFVVFGVVCTKYGFPYSGQMHNLALQRFYVLHCERTFYDAKGLIRKSDSGFFVQSMDRNNLNYVSKIIPELENARKIFEDCESELYCGFPVFTSRFIRPAAYSAWLSADPPTIHHPTSLEVANQTQILVNVRKMRILITGPDHITIVLSPKPGVLLTKWSFDEFEPKESQNWNQRPTYMVYYSHGLMGGTLEFDVYLEINKNQADSVLDVAVIGHYMHDKKFRTDEFKQFLSRFPDWVHLTPWTTTYKSWTL